MQHRYTPSQSSYTYSEYYASRVRVPDIVASQGRQYRTILLSVNLASPSLQVIVFSPRTLRITSPLTFLPLEHF